MPIVLTKRVGSSLLALLAAAPIAAQEAGAGDSLIDDRLIDTAPDDMGEVAPLVSTGEPDLCADALAPD